MTAIKTTSPAWRSTQAPGARAPERVVWWSLFGAWCVASTASLGALFLGEVMQLPTCSLCWYQRVCMFPLALILGLSLSPLDARVLRYAVPLAGAGLLLGLWQQALVWGWVNESLQPCRQGVPCSETVITWFGAVTIPGLSIAAFALILGCLWRAHRAVQGHGSCARSE